ncbi:hypothetical protein DM02DRAFT_711389 [Periconia macrospinosa]|uniref:Protein prenylyltransferase n=1 Tax=Periconia macrospinosa TaxID=97972 RepID=A0A2V1DN75_9PLEO|nr:hypothetical protein DM02DRAFT_711389 [Periconia macrospinosa]
MNLGISKKYLALAFVAARACFFQARKQSGIESIQALEATRTILLFDPEHLTAANHRKRHLLHLFSSHPSSTFQTALRRDLLVITSILTSPLHRQSKSPTLWHHRYWLLTTYASDFPSEPKEISVSSPPSHIPLVCADIDAVCKAGERHPKNYYAWQYARRLISFFTEGAYACCEPKSTASANASNVEKGYADLMGTCVAMVLSWSLHHPADISGWAFLGWFLRCSSKDITLPSPSRAQSTVSTLAVVKCVGDYAVRLEQAKESLWVFLRTVLADGTVGEGGTEEIIGQLKDAGRKSDHGSGDCMILKERVRRTVAWVEKNSIRGNWGDTSHET